MRYIILAFFLIPLFSYSQNESNQYIDKGLLRAQGNITMGTMLAQNLGSFYLTGELEYYSSSEISIRGSSSFLLGSSDGIYGFHTNHSVLIGALYHLKTKSHLDPYFGIEPGFSITKLCGCVVIKNPKPPTTVNPIFTTSMGFNYFANKYFNLFASVRFVAGKHYSDISAVSLNELKFSFGLGFHLWAKKDHFKFVKPDKI